MIDDMIEMARRAGTALVLAPVPNRRLDVTMQAVGHDDGRRVVVRSVAGGGGGVDPVRTVMCSASLLVDLGPDDGKDVANVHRVVCTLPPHGERGHAGAVAPERNGDTAAEATAALFADEWWRTRAHIVVWDHVTREGEPSPRITTVQAMWRAPGLERWTVPLEAVPGTKPGEQMRKVVCGAVCRHDDHGPGDRWVCTLEPHGPEVDHGAVVPGGYHTWPDTITDATAPGDDRLSGVWMGARATERATWSQHTLRRELAQTEIGLATIARALGEVSGDQGWADEMRSAIQGPGYPHNAVDRLREVLRAKVVAMRDELATAFAARSDVVPADDPRRSSTTDGVLRLVCGALAPASVTDDLEWQECLRSPHDVDTQHVTTALDAFGEPVARFWPDPAPVEVGTVLTSLGQVRAVGAGAVLVARDDAGNVQRCAVATLPPAAPGRRHIRWAIAGKGHQVDDDHAFGAGPWEVAVLPEFRVERDGQRLADGSDGAAR